MLILEAQARVCESCYSGDLVPIVSMKGYHRKTKMHRIDSKCSHCGERLNGEWVLEEKDSVLDRIEEGMDRIRKYNKYGRFDDVIKSVSQRVTDSLLSDDNENSPYLHQQYAFVTRIIRHIEQES